MKQWKFVASTLLAAMFAMPAMATYDHSYVKVTNNTPDTLTVRTSLLTDDASFKKGHDWDVLADTLGPYESKDILWFARDIGIRKGSHYRFQVKASSSFWQQSTVDTQFLVTHKALFGSNVDTTLQLPGQNARLILKKSGLEHYQGDVVSTKYNIHARTWRPKMHLFNYYQLVIDKPEVQAVPKDDNNHLRVLTYNTQLMPFYANTVDDLNQPGVRVHDIPKKITEYDVVIMEELFDYSLRQAMIADMAAAYPYHTAVVGKDTDLPLTGGVVIFSKWPIEKEDQMVYSLSYGMDMLAAKGVGYAKINKNGKYYHIFGTHADSTSGEKGEKSRFSEYTEFKQFIDRQAIPANEPVLMGGDMNMNEFNAKEMEVLLTTLNAVAPSNTGFRYSADSVTDTMNNGHNRSRIDFVLYSNEHAKPKVAWNHVYILRALYHEAMWPKFDLSDHFPVDSYFEF